MSLKIEELVDCLNSVQVDKDTFNKIISEAEKIEGSKKSERAATNKKKSKNQFVVVLKSPEKIDPNTVAHVVLIDGEDDAGEVLTKIQSAAREQNVTSKSKKTKVYTIDDLPHIKRRYSKDAGFMVKTKDDWCRTVVVNGDLKFEGVRHEKD